MILEDRLFAREFSRRPPDGDDRIGLSSPPRPSASQRPGVQVLRWLAAHMLPLRP